MSDIIEQMNQEVDREEVRMLLKQIAQLTKERDELYAKLKEQSSHIRCMYCNEKYTVEESDKLADHIMSCDKSPVVQMVRQMESRITDYMDLMNDEFFRITALTDNTEIVGICQRAMVVITQNEPVIKQRDDAVKRAETAEAKCAEMREAIMWFDGYFAVNIDGGGKHSCPWCYQSSDDGKWTEINHSDACLIGHALSDQCGQGWLSPEKKKVLVEALEKIRIHECDCDFASELAKQALEACNQ